MWRRRERMNCKCHNTYRGLRNGCHFSPYTTWALGTKLRSSGLVASVFPIPETTFTLTFVCCIAGQRVTYWPVFLRMFKILRLLLLQQQVSFSIIPHLEFWHRVFYSARLAGQQDPATQLSLPAQDWDLCLGFMRVLENQIQVLMVASKHFTDWAISWLQTSPSLKLCFRSQIVIPML